MVGAKSVRVSVEQLRERHGQLAERSPADESSSDGSSAPPVTAVRRRRATQTVQLGSSPTIGVPAAQVRLQHVEGPGQHPTGDVELAGGDPGQPAADGLSPGISTRNPAASSTPTAAAAIPCGDR